MSKIHSHEEFFMKPCDRLPWEPIFIREPTLSSLWRPPGHRECDKNLMEPTESGKPGHGCQAIGRYTVALIANSRELRDDR